MSTTLFFLVPIGTLAVAWSFCFVGCWLNTHGQGNTTYTDDIILPEPSLVAYWPLGDLLALNTEGQIGTAQDLTGNHNGTYTIPPTYPATPPNSKQLPSPLSLTRKTSIVPGDSGSTKNPLPGSTDFEGGYVSIPWSMQNSKPLTEFTLEAFIKPGWTGSGFIWVMFSAQTASTGFALYINGQNQWELTIGNGTTLTILNTMVPIDPTSPTPTYVALTCDANTNVSLWINPASDTSAPPDPIWTSPMPTGYVAVDPTQPATFFIGAGDTQDAQTLRTVDGGSGPPLFPFQGQIQSVALYSSALSATDLQSHFLQAAG